jgi:uncharacterized surface protein with fasciclin (FAS1) repeats
VEFAMKITHLLPALLLTACAAKSDSAPPVDPEPAEPAAASPEAEAEPADDEDSKADAKTEAKPEAAASKDVVAVIGAKDNTKTFMELLEASGLASTLHSTDGSGFTLLVPTDEAFAKLPKGTIDRLKKNTAELERVLKFHIVTGTHDVGGLGNFRTAPTASGKDIEVKVQDSDVLIHGGKLIETDLKASNGYVHLVDKVLLPKK